MPYLVILLFLLLTSLFAEYKYHIHLYQSRLERFLIPFFFFLVGTIWDSYAVYRKQWSFDYSLLLGVRIGYLPLEEYLFFIIVPYFILTSYRLLTKIIK